MIRIYGLATHTNKERTSGVDFLRIIQPLKHLAKEEGFKVDIYNPHEKEPTHWRDVAPKYDIIYFNYLTMDWGYAAMGMFARKNNTKLVMDMDDNLWSILPDNSAYQVFKKGSKGLHIVTSIINDVDYVTCTNGYLRNAIINNSYKRHDQVKVFPNYIDLSLYKHRSPFRDAYDVVIGHFGCFDEDTEILTENGFKFFKELQKDEKIATLSKDGFLEYQKPINHFKYKYDGELLCGSGKQFSYAVTPNHQLYIGNFLKNNFRIEKAEDIYKKRFRLKKDAKWKGKEEKYIKIAGTKYLTEDWMKFLGFWLAEGWTTNSKFKQKSGTISNCMQIGVVQRKNNGNLEELLKVIRRYHKNIKIDKRRTIRIFNKGLWEYFRQFGYANQKYILKNIKNLSGKYLKILFDWYIKGDGHIEKCGRIRATTTSKKLADDLMEIALKIGWSANIYKKKSKDIIIEGRFIPKERCQSCWYITFLRNTGKKNCLYPKVFPKHQDSKLYKGYVYDVEVLNHTLYVRRNGKCMWSGNSTTHFTSLKNEEFAQAMDRLMREYPNIKFRTIGSFFGDYRQMWGQRYEYSFGNMDVYKWIEMMPDILDKMDIIVAPLTDNIYNRAKSACKYLESSSYIKPFVGQRIRQYSEIIKDGVNGFLCQTRDEWYNNLKKLIDDKILRKNMGEEAFKTTQDWQIQNHIREYKAFFSSILDK